MCGICGKAYFDPARPIDRGELKKMTDVITRRGPDDEGYFVLVGLEAGVYDVTITPEEASGLDPIIIEGVEVAVGNTTTIETVNLE